MNGWIIGLSLGLLGLPMLGAQTPSPAATAIPSAHPILGADFMVPARAVDWSHYTRPEACEAAMQRTADSLGFGVLRDTIHVNLFAPFPQMAIDVGEACLHHFVIATLPDIVLPTLLRVAVTTGDTALVRIIVARQLAVNSDTSAHARAAILATAIRELMAAHRTSAKTQLAQSLMAQGDALGPEVTEERLAMHKAVEAPQGAFRPAANLAYLRTLLAIIQQAPPAIQQQFAGPGSETEADQYGIARNTWLETGHETDFRSYLAAYRGFAAAPNRLMGAQAPPITGAFWFNTSPAGLIPRVPVPGVVNLIVFIDQGDIAAETNSRLRQRLRDLHRDIPDLRITLVARTTGAFQGRLLVAHPEQEAALIHHFVTDSLRLPGMLCVDSGTYYRLPTGAIAQLKSAAMDRYTGGEWNPAMHQSFLIDPHGRVVDIGLGDELQEEEYLIRLLQYGPPSP